jgi:RNA recognition motif-containing protein
MNHLKPENHLTRKKLFIGGLPSSTTSDNLKSYFSQFCQIENCNIIYDKQTSRSRCFGFLTLSKNSSISKILSMKHMIDGKKVDCRQAFPREKKQKSGTQKIFIGGLQSEVTTCELLQYFSRFGAITDSIVMKDKLTGKTRGFGFITFARDSSAEQVLSQKNHYIKGKWIDCKPAVAKQDMSASTDFSNESARKWSSEGYAEELCKNLIDCILEDE